jgi:hypothetical protein
MALCRVDFRKDYFPENKRTIFIPRGIPIARITMQSNNAITIGTKSFLVIGVEGGASFQDFILMSHPTRSQVSFERKCVNKDFISGATCFPFVLSIIIAWYNRLDFRKEVKI